MAVNLFPDQITVTDFQITVREKDGEEDIIIPLEMVSTCVINRQGALQHSLRIEDKAGESISLCGMTKKHAESCQKEILDSVKRAARSFAPAQSPADAEKTLSELAGDEQVDPRSIIHFLIIQAHFLRASDIHFKPGKDALVIFFRIDGLLARLAQLPMALYGKLLHCIKNMARLVSYKKSIPQDGRIRFRYSGVELDIRVAVLPTLFGEKAVFRLLSPGRGILSLDQLGFDPDTLQAFRKLIHRPQGAILLTGPAGSGKTTTIFSSLLELDRSHESTVNISTIEDPIEYMVESFTQTQVNPAMGLTFSTGLRTLLRQDPNIVLVGEIRDEETASIAMQASLSGHLIFSTLHSTGSLGVFSRLMDMGVEPYLVSSCICGVLYQRLVRKVCRECSEPTDMSEEIEALCRSHSIAPGRLMKGKGCCECSNTGYRGRTGIFELLELTPELQELIHRRSPHFELVKKAKAQGLRSLWEDALRKLQSGITTLEEIKRACPAEN